MQRFQGLYAGAAVVVASMLAIPALADTGIMTRETAMGEVLTDANGMTLYTFDKDAEGMSNCYDKCAINWPPLLAEDGAMSDDDDFTLVPRNDGTMQWAYYGEPLYLWIKDQAPGDVTGDGVGGVWHVAKPDED